MNETLPPQFLLGQHLISKGILSKDQLQIALHEQGQSREPLGQLLIRLGFVSEATLRDSLGEATGHQSIDLERILIDAAALALIPSAQARRHRLIPITYAANEMRLGIAMAEPGDIVALDKLRAQLGSALQIDTWLAGEAEILRAIDQHYGHELSIDGILHEIETGEVDLRSLSEHPDEYSQPVVRLLDALLGDAVRRGASDIHFEPEAGFVRIRYRIDGLLRQIRALHKSYWPAMAVRIKVMSGMNIAENRAPQDGRVTLQIGKRAIDFRAAIQPTLHGENIVLRILDRQKGLLPLNVLGFTAEQQQQLRRMLTRPEGIILMTGPTGSGKTTTLYSILELINHEGINIMTLEDPVEYPLPLIRQTSIAEAIKLDFANGIRSIMRQDPDVILVGEIRDTETAEMAFRAAMTGHQVYSTLHTNSALGAIPRLLDIGIVPDIMAGNIIGIIAQRLLRRLCPNCHQAIEATEEQCRVLDIPLHQAPLLCRAGACPACEYQGYRGRIAIIEILHIDEEIDELIALRARAGEIRAAARRKGFRSLAEDGMRHVLAGTTSYEELARVVDLGTTI